MVAFVSTDVVKKLLKVAEDVGEDVPDHWPKQGEDDDNDNCYQHEDESIFN